MTKKKVVTKRKAKPKKKRKPPYYVSIPIRIPRKHLDEIEMLKMLFHDSTNAQVVIRALNILRTFRKAVSMEYLPAFRHTTTNEVLSFMEFEQAFDKKMRDEAFKAASMSREEHPQEES